MTEDELRRDGFGAQPVFRCLLAEVDSVAIGFALFFYNGMLARGRAAASTSRTCTWKSRRAARARGLYY